MKSASSLPWPGVDLPLILRDETSILASDFSDLRQLRNFALMSAASADSTGLTNSLDRYSRQVRFPSMGEAGQRKLMSSRVTICGCGALGTVLANHLVRAGVGHVRIVD